MLAIYSIRITQTNREMKVTKEHKKQIRIGTRAIGDNPTHRHLFQKGAEWAIQKFGGIQWNKYPAVTPPQERTKVLVVMPDGSWREGRAKDGLLFVWLKNPGDWVRTLADYWIAHSAPF